MLEPLLNALGLVRVVAVCKTGLEAPRNDQMIQWLTSSKILLDKLQKRQEPRKRGSSTKVGSEVKINRVKEGPFRLRQLGGALPHLSDVGAYGFPHGCVLEASLFNERNQFVNACRLQFAVLLQELPEGVQRLNVGLVNIEQVMKQGLVEVLQAVTTVTLLIRDD